VRGSNRWIDLPLFQFEPSELAKVLLCVSLAAMVYERVRRPFGLRATLALLGVGLAPAALVFLPTPIWDRDRARRDRHGDPVPSRASPGSTSPRSAPPSL